MLQQSAISRGSCDGNDCRAAFVGDGKDSRLCQEGAANALASGEGRDHPGAFRVRFDAMLEVHSQKGAFPLDTVSSVYITNRDGCSYAEAPVSSKGVVKVDFVMMPLRQGVRLTDRVKFHFFFRDCKDNMLKPISAGHIAMVELADWVKDGGRFQACSNFCSNTVTMNFVPNNDHSRGMHIDLLRLYNTGNIVPSVLSASQAHMETIKAVDEHIAAGLQRHLVVSGDNGGNMFQRNLTAHLMDNEATLYSVYHLDFDGAHNVPPWLCTYLLAETMHHNSVTFEQIKAMDPRALTQFVASYAQALMRSASAAPYTQDLTLTDEPAFAGTRKGTMLSEVFKRPFSHPYALLEKGHGSLIDDDCEGLAAIVRDIANHLGYAYRTHLDDFRQTDTYVRYNTLMRSYFPKDLFSQLSSQYQNKLMDLVMYLGERIANKAIECKITLVSANAPSMGGDVPGACKIQAHACASLVCNVPEFPISVMLEGTACVMDDQYSKRIVLKDRSLLLSDVANSLTVTPPFNTFMQRGRKDVKIGMHVTHTRGSFYRTAFCENESLLGSQIGTCAPLTYGVDMEYLADDSIKVYMPVTGKAVPTDNFEALKQYIAARAEEIHMPLVDHHQIRENLRWAPIAPFRGCKELVPGRPYITCMVHVKAELGAEMDELLRTVTEEADRFNADPSFLALGAMRAFKSMDGVSKVLHLYSDDTEALQARLGLVGRANGEHVVAQ